LARANHGLRPLSPGCLLAVVLGLAGAALLLAGKLLYGLYLAGICYQSDLRWLYELYRLYL
jgi:hypothetical protein